MKSALFSPYVLRYGHLEVPNPDRYPKKFQEIEEKYEVMNVMPVLRLHGVSDLDTTFIKTHKLLELARERQNYRFGDVNGDSVVNILDLTLISQHFGTEKPSSRHADVNKDGVVNILDLIVVAQQID